MRMLDLTCKRCGAEVNDLFVRHVPSRMVHMFCGGLLEQVYRLPRRDAQWGDKDAVVVFKDANGKYRYPGRNDVATPVGCERVVMRSLREVEQFERVANVRSEIAWFDRGSGTRRPDETFRGEAL